MSLRCSSTVCWPELVGFVLLGIICCSLGASAKFQRRFSSYFPQGPLEYLAENIYGDCTMSGNDSSDITFRVLEPNKSEIIAWHSSLAPKTLTSPLHCHSLGNRTCTRLQSVHPYSPRCDKILVSKACQSSSLQATVLPEALSSRKNTNGYMFPYLLYLKDGIVLSCGGVATKCGGLSRVCIYLLLSFLLGINRVLMSSRCPVAPFRIRVHGAFIGNVMTTLNYHLVNMKVIVNLTEWLCLATSLTLGSVTFC